MLTLMEIAEDPVVLRRRLDLREGTEVVFRPLTYTDAERLAGFLEGPVTRIEAAEYARRV
ncbi:hypothetical protein [Streptomyces sp. NBC_00286]|uniref:hypothetical protein n=1 Tax=Streptomyces sp. NBC_00286 TaxID=2975701 RepID=UPI002E2E3252|nr:hypothetical protein [Streptomyces sp. NBC_00286]